MDEQRARELLSAARERVQRALAGLKPLEGETEGDPFDPGEAAPNILEAELETGFAEGLRDQLAAIERAERRLQQGTYGASVESGEPIPDARLEAIAWAERTAEEQARFERMGGA